MYAVSPDHCGGSSGGAVVVPDEFLEGEPRFGASPGQK